MSTQQSTSIRLLLGGMSVMESQVNIDQFHTFLSLVLLIHINVANEAEESTKIFRTTMKAICPFGYIYRDRSFPTDLLHHLVFLWFYTLRYISTRRLTRCRHQKNLQDSSHPFPPQPLAKPSADVTARPTHPFVPMGSLP